MDNKKQKATRFYLSRKLIGIVTLFIIAASGLVVLTNFSINMIAATGDYTRLISEWSQNHYQSATLVERFALSGKKKDYRAFEELTDEMTEQARIIDELFKTDPNVALIYDLLVSNNIDPNEISSLILGFQQFGETDRMKNIHELWKQMKQNKEEKERIIQLISGEWNQNQPDQSQINHHLSSIIDLDQAWISQNHRLMTELAGVSGAIKRAGLWTSVILGILLVLIGVVVTVRANKSIGRWEQILNEKEALISEIHHRVKNNLAVISSLLELESMQKQDSKRALEDSRDRIKSMAIIHENLYQSDSFSEINLGQYLQQLTGSITNTYNRDEKDIKVHVPLADIVLNINQAVPVGLIINEMLAYAITHSCDKRTGGKIELFLSEQDGRVSLSVKDYGKGFPKDFNNQSADSTGLMIAKILVQQLEAKVTFKSGEDDVTMKLQFHKSDAPGSSNAIF